MSWFSYFGRVGDEILPLDDDTSSVSAEIDQGDDEVDVPMPVTQPITLIELDEDSLFKGREFFSKKNIRELADSVKKGAVKRYAKHALHDEIVADFSKKFKAQGARVLQDINTVDLLVLWGEKSAFFEVKTVNNRSLQSRLRLAVGQVEEYSFRLRREQGLSPDRCIIINRPLDRDSWQAEFLTQHMNVGVISRTSSGNALISPRVCETCERWL